MAPREPAGNNKQESVRIMKIAQKTTRMEMFWLGGKREELPVYRVPIGHLYFNIENGRYADKMVQLRNDNPGVEIDPKDEHWKGEIWRMLRGEYPGSEQDKEPFEKLKKDLMARQQLHPGVVLNDGGVLDGNRRFAVLKQLYETEGNPARYEYLDAAVLPENVSAEDRWRIEAGLQIGKDEKLDYSPINRLLKIKEGQKLFSHRPDPAQEIANTLIGVSREEVEKDIQKINFIDQYLKFIERPDSYSLVSGVMERFEEAINILEAARKAKMAPQDVAALRLKLFTFIRFEILTNWELRKIKTAIGVPGRGRGQDGRNKNEEALKRLLEVKDKAALKEALIKNDRKSEVVQDEDSRAQTFEDEMETAALSDEPFRLAERAQANLRQLKETLENKNVSRTKDWVKQVEKLQQILKSVTELTSNCTASLKRSKK